MKNKELIEQLNKIGRLPTSEISDETDFPLKEFDDLLHQFTLPIDYETAVNLVNLSPPVDESCYNIEWALIHLVENINTKELQKVLDNSKEGEVKNIIQIRLNNYNAKNS